MPDDRVKISALDSASTMETGDMFPVTQERNGVKKTNKAFMSQIASEVVNGIEYTTALNTDDKKPIGAINELLDRLIALLPVVSFSPAPIATIANGAENVPMKSLIVDIVPKETGTGTKSPSNPYVISGSDEVVITHTGKNLFDKSTITTGKYISNTGSEHSSANGTYSDFITIKIGIRYYFSHIVGNRSFYSVAVYDNKKTFIKTVDISGGIDASNTLTFDEGAYIRVNVHINYIDVCQIEFGSTATDYEPYTATTHTIALPSTVYGGEVDVVSGQGNITYGVVDLSQVQYTITSWGGYKLAVDNCKPFANANVATCKASIYATTSYNDLNTNKPNNSIAIASTGNVYLVSDNTPTGLLVFELATPTPITTTPIQIKTMGGTESIFADCGNVSGEYRADIQKYIDGIANNGGNRSLNSLNLSKGAIVEEPEKEEVKEEEPKEEEKK